MSNPKFYLTRGSSLIEFWSVMKEMNTTREFREAGLGSLCEEDIGFLVAREFALEGENSPEIIAECKRRGLEEFRASLGKTEALTIEKLKGELQNIYSTSLPYVGSTNPPPGTLKHVQVQLRNLIDKL